MFYFQIILSRSWQKPQKWYIQLSNEHKSQWYLHSSLNLILSMVISFQWYSVWTFHVQILFDAKVLQLMHDLWLRTYTIQINSTEAQTKKYTLVTAPKTSGVISMQTFEALECPEFLWTLNSVKCCDIELQIHKIWNERTPHKERSRSNSWLRKYLLAGQNIFSHDEVFSCSTMANHVRSPISVSIPEAVTQDGVTIYKIHVSLISLYIKMSSNFHD